MGMGGNNDRYERRSAYLRQMGEMLHALPYNHKDRLEGVSRAMIEARFLGRSEINPCAFFDSLEDIARKTNGQTDAVIDSIIRQVDDLVVGTAKLVPTNSVVNVMADCVAYAREVSMAYTGLKPEDAKALDDALQKDFKDNGALRREVRRILGRVPYTRTVVGAPTGVYRGAKKSGWVQGKRKE